MFRRRSRSPYPTKIKSFAVVLLIYFLTGCQVKHRLYTGPELPKTQIAVVAGQAPIQLFEVDGKRGPNRKRYNSFTNGSFIIELLPGIHTFNIGFGVYYPESQMSFKSTSNITLTLDAEPGKYYTIEAVTDVGPSSSQWGAEITEWELQAEEYHEARDMKE